jgi:hypothetical protein
VVAVVRDRDVRVRLSEAEWAAWDTARVASGVAEMGPWVRATVQQLLAGWRPPRRRARVGLGEITAVTVRRLATVATDLHRLAGVAETEQRAEAALLRAVAAATEDVLAELRGTRPRGGSDAGDVGRGRRGRGRG